jgi:hypothetical protein
VPEEIIRCISAFLDVCYIARRQDISNDALDAFDAALNKFWELREVFRSSGVRPTGFSLPRQHALFHYRRQIEDFGAPGGLCSSIMESRHITAVKRPWRRSNRYNAIGQMLVTNQRLEKLAAMQSDFVARGMLPGGHKSGKNMTTHVFEPKYSSRGEEDDAWPAEEENVLGNVVLARTRGMLFSLITTLIRKPLTDTIKHANIPEIYMDCQIKLRNQICLS